MILLAFDQASITTGYAVFIDNKLIKAGHFTCRDTDFGERLTQFRKNVIVLLNEYHPNQVVFEDIQLQERVKGQKNTDSVITFKKLAEVFGVLYELVSERGIPNAAIIPNVWKATFKIAGKGRTQEKKMAQQVVLNTYGIHCTEDEADAVCIGAHYLTKQNNEFDWS